MALDGIPVNGILHTGQIDIGITVVREGIGMGIAFVFVVNQAACLHIACCFFNQLPMVTVAVNFQPQHLKGVQIDNCNIVLSPIGAYRKIAAGSAHKTILLGDGGNKVNVLIFFRILFSDCTDV